MLCGKQISLPAKKGKGLPGAYFNILVTLSRLVINTCLLIWAGEEQE